MNQANLSGQSTRARQRNAPPARHRGGLAGIAGIAAPILVVAGGPTSHLPQDLLARTAERVPGSRLVTVDAGHMVHHERPAERLAAVRGFLGAPGAHLT